MDLFIEFMSEKRVNSTGIYDLPQIYIKLSSEKEC